MNELREEITTPSADGEGTETVVVTEPTTTDESANEERVPTPGQVDPAFEARRQRILEHRVAAQAEPDTRIAYVAGLVSDLLDTELVISEGLRQGLAAGGSSLENILRHSPLIDVTMRCSKQICQLAQLELRLHKSNAKEDAAPKPR